MYLYLVRHGESKSKEADPERPLSEKGSRDILEIAKYLCKTVAHVGSIFHSGKLRAKQTAEIISGELNLTEGVSEKDGLAPLDEPAVWVERLSQFDENIVLVGHLPHLEKLTTHLLSGVNREEDITFSAGQIVCLMRDDNGTWTLQWSVAPGNIP